MNTPEQAETRLPSGSSPATPPSCSPLQAGGGTALDAIDRTMWPDAPILRVCVCTHVESLHNLSTDQKRRTGCSVSDGPKATPCGCKAFKEKPEVVR